MSEKHEQMQILALAGNPNVGKSTVFNGLTGLRQHTGNWSGKTVETATGVCRLCDPPVQLVDLPGVYSLFTHSPEEEVACDYLWRGEADGAVVVCDACSLERSLTPALQIMELQPNTLICLNLMDEAQRRGIELSTEELSKQLGARGGNGEGGTTDRPGGHAQVVRVHRLP